MIDNGEEIPIFRDNLFYCEGVECNQEDKIEMGHIELLNFSNGVCLRYNENNVKIILKKKIQRRRGKQKIWIKSQRD